MSTDTQAIFFFIAFLGCLLAGFGAYSAAAAPRPWYGTHFGWLGLASFVFVFFWNALKAG